MRLAKLITTLFMAAVLALPSMAQETLQRVLDKGQLRVGMSGTQPPFSMKIGDDQFIGYEVDLARAVANAMDVELEIVELPFDELLPALNRGEVDVVMSGMTITPQRSVEAMFAGPYTLSGKSVLTKSNVISKAESADDVNQTKYKVAALQGSNSEEYVKKYMPNAELVPVENYDAGIDMVLSDAADAMVADYPVCVIAALEHANDDLVTLNQPLSIEPIGMALPAGDVQFHSLIENYIHSMDISGTLDMLESAWFGDGSWLNHLKN